MHTNVSFKRLDQILKTVNPRTVKSIKITLSSSCSSDMPFWADVEIGYRTYRLILGDIDDRYWKDTVISFFDIIRDSKINYTCNEYKQQTCSGYKIWSI